VFFALKLSVLSFALNEIWLKASATTASLIITLKHLKTFISLGLGGAPKKEKQNFSFLIKSERGRESLSSGGWVGEVALEARRLLSDDALCVCVYGGRENAKKASYSSGLDRTDRRTHSPAAKYLFEKAESGLQKEKKHVSVSYVKGKKLFIFFLTKSRNAALLILCIKWFFFFVNANL
jgi:hypothetical protein